MYDVTKWLPDHPGKSRKKGVGSVVRQQLSSYTYAGGRKILLGQGGKDASAKFKQYHARSILENVAPKFYIGDVAQPGAASSSDDAKAAAPAQEKEVFETPDEIPDYSPIPFANPTWYADIPSPYYNKPSYARVRNFVRNFVTKEIIPFVETWDEAKRIPREVYEKCGRAGLIAACAHGASEKPE